MGKKKAAIVWDDRCQWPFDDLNNSAPQHIFFPMQIFTRPLKLPTDACGSSLGAVLYQTFEDDMDVIIAYANRSLTKTESHYPAHKLKFLTLKWAVVG